MYYVVHVEKLGPTQGFEHSLLHEIFCCNRRKMMWKENLVSLHSNYDEQISAADVSHLYQHHLYLLTTGSWRPDSFDDKHCIAKSSIAHKTVYIFFEIHSFYGNTTYLK